MNKWMKAVVFFTFATGALLASDINDSNTVETVGSFIRGLKICHQHEWRNLAVDLEYDADNGSSAMDIQTVKAHVRTFFEEYSNPDDFWEIMNINLVHSLARAFPEMVSMKSTLALAADRTLIFPRESTVRYNRNAAALKESFGFTKLEYLICQETFRALDLYVSWDMKDNPGPFDYPDYLWIDEAMDGFFTENPVSLSKWKDLKPKLEAHLLERFPSLASIDVKVIAAE